VTEAVQAIHGTRFQVPAIVFPNLYWLGDNVLLEPIARYSSVRDKTYVLSKYPELFEGHPSVVGIKDQNQVPGGARIIDLAKTISGVEKDDEGRYIILPDKNQKMWVAAGFDRVMDHPRLYLTASEFQDTMKMKKWFNRPCIGVVLRSRHKNKDWAYMMLFIRALIKKKHFDVFIFAKDVNNRTLAMIPPGAHFWLNRPIREVMQGLAMMDVVITPDTGLGHISAALGTQTVVVCFDLFHELYSMYSSTTILSNDNFTKGKGITGVSVKRMLKEVDKHLLGNKNHIPVAIGSTQEWQDLLFIRFRGIGDVLLSLPALATYKKLHPNTAISYMTSPGVGDLIEACDVVDSVVKISYDHSSAGLPLPPKEHDYDDYDSVVNAMNAIDFLSESSVTPRAELFGDLLELDRVDFSADWKFKIPGSWTEIARRKLHYAGVNKKTIVMQADSKGLSRIWPMERQKEFMGMARKKGYIVVVVSDKQIPYPEKDSILNFTGELSFQEYVGMIGACDILLSPDSGGIHIAGITDQLALGLFGSVLPELRVTHYSSVETIVGKAKCVPCNDWQQNTCRGLKRSPMCMWSIKPDTVMKKIESMLKRAKEADANG